MTPPATAAPETTVYVTRIQQTRLPGFNHVWFRCTDCDLQGDMTGTNDETDEVLAVLGAAHAARHGSDASQETTRPEAVNHAR